MQRFLKQLTPFIILGIVLIALAFGMILLAYLFLFGAILGGILYLIRWIQLRFFPSKTRDKAAQKKGRIIDSNDWKKL
jgi:hypothetical protein